MNACALSLLIIFSLFGYSIVSGQERRARMRVIFRVGSSTVEHGLEDNANILSDILSILEGRDSTACITNVRISGYASPDGGDSHNKRLSAARVHALEAYLRERVTIADSVIERHNGGIAWEQLAELVEKSDMSHKEEVLHVLRNVPEYTYNEHNQLIDSRKKQVMDLQWGRTWHYLSDRYFPLLRNADIVIATTVREKKLREPETGNGGSSVDIALPPGLPNAREEQPLPDPDGSEESFPKFSVKTNLLYDALAVPNLGVEFCLGEAWRLAANWMYGRWNMDDHRRYLFLYGGDLALRRWFGKRERPFTGHHAGVYGQLFTYDFRWGDKGYMGGKPNGALWEGFNYVVGVEYGYSLPVAKRLNLDFTVGAGYWGGTYYQYVPQDGHSVWQATKSRRWFGPTKAEVSLVWYPEWRKRRKQDKTGGKKTKNKKEHDALMYGLLMGCMLMLFPSCELRGLCYTHDEHALKSDVLIEAAYAREWHYTYEGGTDWKNYPTWAETFGMEYDAMRPDVPEGLRVQTYRVDGTGSMVNLPPSGGIVNLRPGEQSLLFYNNDTEYIVFSGTDAFASAKATTRTRTRFSYFGSPYLESREATVAPPDMLYGAYVESLTVNGVVETVKLPVTMHPLVYTYLVRYEFSHGLEHVALARGALAGMAEAVWLNSGRTSDESATLLYDCTLQEFGAQAVVKSFGVPDFPNERYRTRNGHKYALNLEVKLRNGKVKTFDFDVTDQLAVQPQGGVIVVRGIVITDEEGKEGGSGFDVNVDDWGDYEDVDIQL